MEARSFGEPSEVPVSREEGNTLVNTALGDQRVAEARLAAFGQCLRPQDSCPLPIAKSDLDEGYVREGFGNAGRKLWIAQQFGEHNWHHEHLPVSKRPIEQLCILADAAF